MGVGEVSPVFSPPLSVLNRSVTMKTRPVTNLLLVLGLLGTAVSAPIAAEALPAYGILPASILRMEAIELAADDLKGSGNWRGLVCAAQGCELRPVKLEIQKQPEPGKLRISHSPVRKKKVKGEFTIALVRGISGTGKKAIPTWFTLRTPRNPEDAVNGSLGITVNTPQHGDYHLIPRWNQKSGENGLTLYLENRQQRQRLGSISLEALDAGLKTRDILIWAGDLDGDGKIDLITRASDSSSTGGLYLWLSSHAGEGEIVGIAASLDNWIDVEKAEGC